MQTEETMSNDISADLFEFQSSEDWKALSPYRQKVVQYIFKKLDKNSSGFIEFSDLKLFFSNSVLPNLKARTCLGLSLEYQLKFSVQHECMIDSGCIPQSLSILIVDDSTTVLKVSTAVFEKAGHRVDVATNGKIGLEKMLKKFYDIVLLDVHMPEMDGLETMSLFREQEHSLGREKDKIQFVIAISSNTDELTKKNCMRAGMDAFIKKPFGIGNIVKFVTAFCSKLCINHLIEYYTDISDKTEDDQKFAADCLDEFLFKIEDFRKFVKEEMKKSRSTQNLLPNIKSSGNINATIQGNKPTEMMNLLPESSIPLSIQPTISSIIDDRSSDARSNSYPNVSLINNSTEFLSQPHPPSNSYPYSHPQQQQQRIITQSQDPSKFSQYSQQDLQTSGNFPFRNTTINNSVHATQRPETVVDTSRNVSNNDKQSVTNEQYQSNSLSGNNISNSTAILQNEIKLLKEKVEELTKTTSFQQQMILSQQDLISKMLITNR